MSLDISLSLRFLQRDWRSGELNLLLLALIICVASITTVAFFIDRMQQAINQQSSEMLAADFVIAANRPIDPDREKLAKELGLRTSMVMLFRSVLLASDAMQLIEAKVVDADYPLRGKLQLSDQPYSVTHTQQGMPTAGEVWVEPRLLQALNVAVGDKVQLGTKSFTIGKVLRYEPDRGGDFFRMAPRVMLAESDLAATQLIQPGSRVSHRLLVSGNAQQIAKFITLVKTFPVAGEELISIKEGRPEIRFAFERADFFLNIVALISVLLGSVATAMAAQRYTRRHIDTVAILRTFGMTQRQIFQLYFLAMSLFALIAGLIGCGIGYLAQYALSYIMAGLIVGELPAPGYMPVVVGLITGYLALLGFVIPQLWLLKRVPPVRVLRRNQSISLFNRVFVLIFLASIFTLWIWRLGYTEVTQYLLAGVIGTLIALFVVARITILFLRPIRGIMSSSWRYGLANITRRGTLSAIQISAFGLGIMFILLSSLIRTEMLDTWTHSLPADAPNYFLTNAQADQLHGIREFFHSQQTEPPEFAPMTRGRLLTINDREVRVEDFDEPRAKNLILHEFNLSWSQALRAGNVVQQGRWWRDDERARPYISLETSVAKALRLKLGDKLKFNIAGTELEVEVLNTRKVDWNSFRVNFFAVLPAGLLEEMPSNWVASMHLDVNQAGMLTDLIKRFPNLTVIDIDVIIDRIRTLMSRVAAAVEYLLAFTFLIGVVIMLIALKTTEDERRQEAALLHTLGARRVWILRGAIAEFALLGMVAGTIAGTAAMVTAHFIASEVFKFEYAFSFVPVLIGLLIGAVLVTFIGFLGTNKVLSHPPIETFRQA